MIAAPKRPPLPASSIRGDDPSVEAEFTRQMAALRAEDAAQAAYEGEFVPAPYVTPEERHERAYTRMEQDVDMARYADDGRVF